MAAQPKRNAPCPCGSGKRYKHCHERDETGTEASRGSKLAWIVFAIIVIGTTVAVGLLVDWKTGLGCGGGAAILVGIFFMSRNPPPPKSGSGDPAGMNFGR